MSLAIELFYDKVAKKIKNDHETKKKKRKHEIKISILSFLSQQAAGN